MGVKSRGVYETPGGAMLMEAHKALETLTLERDTMHYKQILELKYAEMIYNGQWFHPLRESLDAFIDKTQETVNGTATMKLYKGNCIAASRKSPDSLYDMNLSTFVEGRELRPEGREGIHQALRSAYGSLREEAQSNSRESSE